MSRIAGWDEERRAALCARLQPLAEEVSGRTDLVVVLRETPADGPAVRWDAGAAQVQLAERLLAGRSGADRDLATPRGRREHADLVGLVVLGAGLAGYGLGPFPDDAAPRWATLLDAVRACSRVVRQDPAQRIWLRAGLQLSCPLGAPGTIPVSATGSWYLGQVPAGVVAFGEAARVLNHLLLVMGPTGVGVLQEVLRAAVEAESSAELLALAGRLADLLDREDTDAGQADVVVEQTRQVAHEAQVLLAPQPPGRDPDAPTRDELADQRLLSRAAAGRVFARGDRAVTRREPLADTRAAGRRMAAALRQVRPPPAELTRVPSAVPPGRTRMAELMRRDAQVAAHTQVTANPWRRLRRLPPVEQRLRVALSWDVSGSRRAVHDELCELAWALSHATRLVDGEVAAVAWNDRVLPVVRPGTVSADVVDPGCGGRSGGGAESVRALDGALHLCDGDGVRVLLIASDGRVPNRRGLQREVDRVRAQGVDVLWLGEGWSPSGVTRVPAGPGQAQAVLTRALVDALR